MSNSTMLSELKVYSLGIVAENKKLDSRVVEITPIEHAPMLDGEIKSGLVSDSVNTQDSNGGTEEIATTTANSIPATWLPLGSSNRFTAPDVRRGEQVVLYRFADQDKFFWTTLYDDIKLRKLETAIWVFSGTKDENAEVSGANYYFVEVSTHKGLIHLHTSKANGEFCSYDFQIDAKNGVIHIQDDVGNVFVFDSKERQIGMQNADQCSLEINKKNITLVAPETYTLKAKNKVEEIGETVQITAGNSIAETTKAFTVKASDSLRETVGSYNLNADSSINESAGGALNITATGAGNISASGLKLSHGVALS